MKQKKIVLKARKTDFNPHMAASSRYRLANVIDGVIYQCCGQIHIHTGKKTYAISLLELMKAVK